MPADIKSNVKQVERGLALFSNKKYRRAVRFALKDTVRDLRDFTVKSTFRQAFRPRRRNFAAGVIRFDTSQIRDFTASVLDATERTAPGSRAPREYLLLHENAGVKKPLPGSRYIPVPTNRVKYRSGLVIDAHKPSNIVDHPRGFILERTGVPMIAMRTPAGEAQVFYWLVRRARIRDRLDFAEESRKFTDEVLPRQIEKQVVFNWNRTVGGKVVRI